MSYLLFEQDFYDYRETETKRAVEYIRAISKGELHAVGPDRLVHEIMDKICFDVAVLDLASRRGKRRMENSGTPQQIEYIDVNIPFSGEAKSFFYAPSSRTLMYQRARVNSDSLVVPVPAARDVDGEVNGFTQVVNETLETLKKEMVQYRKELEAILTREVRTRAAHFEEQAAATKKLSFPVDD